MLSWLRKLIYHSKEDLNSRQLNQLASDIGSDSTHFPIEDLRPVLIPSSIFEAGRWIGPFHYFRALPVSLTWAFMRPEETMLYLDHEAAAAFETKGVDWRQEARKRLAEEFERRPWSHEFRNGGEIEAVAMMHDDGLGPSRLIMYNQIAARFPQGFSFFVPERSCALVIGNDATAKIKESVEITVQRCFSAADVPMSKNAYDHILLKQALLDAHESV